MSSACAHPTYHRTRWKWGSGVCHRALVFLPALLYTTPAAAADLALTAATPPAVFAGDTLDLRAWATHVSGAAAGPATATITLSAGLGPVTAFADTGICTMDTAGFACTWADFATTTTYALRATLATLSDGTWPVTTTLAAASDTTTANNSATVTATVTAAADVAVGIVALPAAATLADEVEWKLTVLNRGPSVAQAVTLAATQSGPGTLLTTVASSGTCAVTAAVVWCGFGTLAANTTASLTLAVQPTAVATLTLAATVSATTYERVPADNTAMRSIGIAAVPDSDNDNGTGDGGGGNTVPFPLSFAPGPNAPTGVLVAALGDANVPMLQFSAAAGAEIELRGLTFRPDGSGNETRWVRGATLRLDADGDGLAGSGDPVLATGVFAADNAPLTLAFSTPQILAPGAAPLFLLTYDLGLVQTALAPLGSVLWPAVVALLGVGAWPLRRRYLWPTVALALAFTAACGGTDTATESATFQVTLTDVNAVRLPLGTTLSTVGLPVVGPVLTVIAE